MVLRRWPTRASSRWCCFIRPLDAIIFGHYYLYGLCIETTTSSYLEIQPFFIYFLEHFPYLCTHINLSIFNSFIISFLHRTKHKPISYYKQIEWKNLVTIFIFTTGKTTDGRFGHDGFASNFYFHFWGNSSSSFKQVYIMYK